MKEIQDYVMFTNHENGMRLQKELKTLGIQAKIAPTPRAASKCCGILLLVKKEDLNEINRCIEERGIEIWEIAEVEKDINPYRDRYCQRKRDQADELYRH